MVFFKSARRVESPILQFEKKTALKKAYFLQKFDFCIFEHKNCEVIENSSEAPLNLSPLKCTYLGKNSFQYHKR